MDNMTQADLLQTSEINEERTIPVYLLSGFLGSGKTTLLNHLIDYYKALNVKTAVVMNELGDVNLDGQFIDDDVPMAEMLSGCICCTIRGDLSLELKQLIDEHNPDVVLIESTGAAESDGNHGRDNRDCASGSGGFTRHCDRGRRARAAGAQQEGRPHVQADAGSNPLCDRTVSSTRRISWHPEDLVDVQQLVRELNAFAPLTVTIKSVMD